MRVNRERKISYNKNLLSFQIFYCNRAQYYNPFHYIKNYFAHATFSHVMLKLYNHILSLIGKQTCFINEILLSIQESIVLYFIVNFFFWIVSLPESQLPRIPLNVPRISHQSVALYNDPYIHTYHRIHYLFKRPNTNDDPEIWSIFWYAWQRF